MKVYLQEEPGFFKPLALKLLLMMLILNPYFLQAQSQEKVYSALMLNFSKGMEWPKGNSTGKFVIGIFEYQPLAAELKIMAASMKVNNRKIEVRELTSVEEIDACNILFVPAYKARSIPDVLRKIGKDPTLLVTNKMDMAKKGSGVNFVLVEGKLKYEINCKSIESRGLKISSAIKNMGIIVTE